MKEIRKMSMYDLRKACIYYNWYTWGDDEEYEYILNYANDLERVTTDELETIASDIKKHSDTDYEIKDIMFVLANEFCKTFIED